MEHTDQTESIQKLRLYHPMIIPLAVGIMIVVGIVLGVLVSLQMEKPSMQPEPQGQPVLPTPTIEYAPENVEL